MLICAAEIGIFSLNRNIKNSEENNWEEHLDLRALVNKRERAPIEKSE